MAVLTAWLGVVAGVCPLAAQQPAGGGGKEKESHMRFWNLLPDKPSNNLLVFAGDKPLFGAAPFDLFNDYTPTPVGTYGLVIKRSAENSPVLQKLTFDFQDNMFVTILAREKDGQPVVEVFNDTPDPKVTDLSAQLIVRSFFTGGAVTVGITGGQPAQPIPGGATVILDNLPMTADVNINIQVTTTAVPPVTKTWNLPEDFSVTHHATLLLIPDHYGRLVPKFLYSGRLAYPHEKRQQERH